MNQSQPENNPDGEITLQRSDGDEGPRHSASSENPSPWWLNNRTLRTTLICFAGWGALMLTYQLISALGGSALWLLTAVTCVVAALTHRSWRPEFQRLFRRIWPAPRTDPPVEWFFWKALIGIFIVLALRPVVDRVLPKTQPSVSSPSAYPGRSVTLPGPDQMRSPRGEATRLYWQVAVSNLHALRFATPSGKQSAAEYAEVYFKELQARASMAKAASTFLVESDLLQMAQRHLAVDEQYLQLKPRLDRLNAELKMPANNATLDEGNSVWQSFLTALQRDPELLTKLPASPERELVEKFLELEQQRSDQLHEIEVMQAVLHERFPEVPFALPSLEP